MKRKNKKKALLIAWAGLCGIVAIAVLVYSGERSTSVGAAGTMAGAMTMDMSGFSIGWQAGADSRLGFLGDDLEAAVTVQANRAVAGSEFQLFFSRDDQFDEAQDCLVQSRSLSLDADLPSVVQFRAVAYESPCLDAGPWHVAVRAVDVGEWMPFQETLEIQGGMGHMVLAQAPREIGFQEPLTLDVDVLREASDKGVEGLWKHPASVWLQQGKQVCVIAASDLTIPRDPGSRFDTQWIASRVRMEVDPGKARQVSTKADLDELAGTDAATVTVEGPCRIEEGEWRVAVGPGSARQVEIQTLYIHAAPVSIDTTPIKVTMVEGTVTSVERTARNPSSRKVQWSAAPEDFLAEGWLIGAADRQLRAGRDSGVQFTISAADLQPGFYEGAFVFAAGDYYGTRITIPVELTVEASRRVVQEEADVPESTFELSNYPNPFNGRTTISLQMKEGGQVQVTVYDVAGREVRRVIDEWLDQGSHEFSFDADGLPSGTYLYRAVTGSGALSRTMTLVR